MVSTIHKNKQRTAIQTQVVQYEQCPYPVFKTSLKCGDICIFFFFLVMSHIVKLMSCFFSLLITGLSGYFVTEKTELAIEITEEEKMPIQEMCGKCDQPIDI